MLCIHSKNRDPYFNLAAEEYLLRQTEDDVFLLWQSNPVVVIGKHQNALAEVNYRFVRSHGIRVARRLTGGGAVYHDEGNLNFSFIRQGEPGKLVDFGSFIEPIISFLKTMGIEAHRGSKNEILVNDKKISGNAEHVYKNRVLHHGTLLYNSDLGILRESIKRSSGRYVDKAVQSNRSSVMNLADCLGTAMGITDFQKALFENVMNNRRGQLFIPDEKLLTAIQQLANEKFNTWAWIFGWSPDYEFENSWQSGNLDIAISLRTHRGIITGCTLKSTIIPLHTVAMLSERLTGIAHEESQLRRALEPLTINSVLGHRELDDLVLSFF